MKAECACGAVFAPGRLAEKLIAKGKAGYCAKLRKLVRVVVVG